MSLMSHAERLQKRLDNLQEQKAETMTRAVHVGEFIAGCAGSSAYRAWLSKNGKEMPKFMKLDADTALGALLVIGGFLDIIPDEYADHALNFGAGLVSGAIANKVAGAVNPAIATKGEDQPYQLGMADVSAHRGSNIMEMIRARQAALAVVR